MTAPVRPDPRRKRLALLARSRHAINLLFWAAFVASSLVLQRNELSTPARLAIALAPVLPLALLVWTYWMFVRTGCFDEFGRRVLLEAAATVFIVGMPLLLLFAMLRNAEVFTSALDWQGVFIGAALLFGAGVLRGLKRYQGALRLEKGGAP